ncbi:AMP-binding protein, partial [Kribbia dieselivorans]|uniref:AMP-binding protein n=1 Tax=Kribbia dieselivorans TaxID=331526 RepID=UPI0012EDBA51
MSVVPLARPQKSGAPFAPPFAVPPSAPALMSADGQTLSHADLHTRVAGLAAELPDAADGRRLVHLPLTATVDGVLAYLATLAAGHVALVTGDDPRSQAILETYRPDVTASIHAGASFDVTSRHARHLLHPDLALLLSTSGSTGSPKLVRLSHDNVRSNAVAIGQALRLTPADRAITSLPLTYCFGLSVIHSHLTAGASVVLHDGSVLDPQWWRVVDVQRVTTLAVVPHMVELMESTGVLGREHPSLRLIAQAGGRLAPERVRRLAATGAEFGWDLAVMYGQTEATARIAVLDPADVADHPDAVGRPVPGTTLRLDPTVPEA